MVKVDGQPLPKGCLGAMIKQYMGVAPSFQVVYVEAIGEAHGLDFVNKEQQLVGNL